MKGASYNPFKTGKGKENLACNTILITRGSIALMLGLLCGGVAVAEEKKVWPRKF